MKSPPTLSRARKARDGTKYRPSTNLAPYEPPRGSYAIPDTVFVAISEGRPEGEVLEDHHLDRTEFHAALADDPYLAEKYENALANAGDAMAELALLTALAITPGNLAVAKEQIRQYEWRAARLNKRYATGNPLVELNTLNQLNFETLSDAQLDALIQRCERSLTPEEREARRHQRELDRQRIAIEVLGEVDGNL